MKIFLSWSGDRSKEVAQELRKWLPNVLQSADPFMSNADIKTGTLFFKVIRENLERSDFGIVCLTEDSRVSPWLLFESGALAKAVKESSLCPYMIDIKDKDLPGPLKEFQAVTADKQGTLKLVLDILSATPAPKPSEQLITQSFDRWWPEFKPVLDPGGKLLGQSVTTDGFVLINAETNKVLTASGKPRTDGETIKLSTYTGDERELWKFHYFRPSHYTLVSVSTGQCLDVADGSEADAAKIHQWKFEDGDNQKWALVQRKDGYNLRAKHSKKFLGVTNGEIKQKEDGTQPAQIWRIDPFFPYYG